MLVLGLSNLLTQALKVGGRIVDMLAHRESRFNLITRPYRVQCMSQPQWVLNMCKKIKEEQRDFR